MSSHLNGMGLNQTSINMMCSVSGKSRNQKAVINSKIVMYMGHSISTQI